MLQLLGASMALAGAGSLTGCIDDRADKILPYAQRPPEITPGLPVQYATSMVLDGFATGLLVQAREGRPIKIEGNPEHPASLGATSALAQAAVLQLYDPDRARGILRAGAPSSWQTFIEEVVDRGVDQATTRDTARPRPGLRFLLHPQSSPLIAAMMDRIRALRPDAGFAFHAPLDRRAVYAGARRVFGRALETHYDFRAAKIVLALDADFMATMPNAVRWARDFAAARRVAKPTSEMNRLYVAEAMPSATGTLADHRLPVRSGDVTGLAARVLAALASAPLPGMPAQVAQALRRAMPAAEAPDPSGRPEEAQREAWLGAVVRDLRANAGAGIVIAGDRQSEQTHALVHLINAALGNLGRTVSLTEPVLLEPEGSTLTALVADMERGAVDTLVIVEANPVYTAPADLDFARALARVPRRVHLSLFYDETSRACNWFLPAAHFLESWSDARAYDGTLSFAQPLIEPLYGGKSPAELLAAFAGQPRASGESLLRDLWIRRLGAAAAGDAGDTTDTEPSALVPVLGHLWRQHIQRGLIPGSRAPAVTPAVQWHQAADLVASVASVAARPPAPPAPPAPNDRGAEADIAQGLELNLEPSPKVYDGRFANNGWLQELPHPTTKLTWDNAAMFAPDTAATLGIATGDVVELRVRGRQGERSVRAPALLLPGHARQAVTLALGYGRDGTERLARGVGVNAYRLRTTDAPYHASGLQVTRTGAVHRLALAQQHHALQGRPLAPMASLAQYRANPGMTRDLRGPLPSMLAPDHRTPDAWDVAVDQWAMTIDTGICNGCSACVVACQAENNIPLVGKRGVENGREMHWLRIDRYITGPSSNPQVINQPMMCQHCENAPCEYVCPVNATVHSPDGLNEMVYNRCIGTRFCSNNCPYKVRRFNWFEYTDDATTTALQRNPEVTVRERGVMEKCTYCVQRIRRAEIQARIERRGIRPGEITTACQQACPTTAIQFASLRHETSNMVQWRREPRAYAVLHDQGTRPRTMYLAKIVNPAPGLAPAQESEPR